MAKNEEKRPAAEPPAGDEAQPVAEPPPGKAQVLKGRGGVTVRLPDVQRGPRSRLCELLRLKKPTDVQLFEDAAAEIERLRAQPQK